MPASDTNRLLRGGRDFASQQPAGASCLWGANRSAPTSFDVVVVGAGPAGTSAALGLARKGARVALLERGEYPGAKNMFGGMMAYSPVPEFLVPGFWDKAPWERAVTKRTLSVMTGGSTTSLTFQAASGSERPSVGAGSTSDRSLTGFTLYRPLFDRWYAEQAVALGVTLLTGCRADSLVKTHGEVRGVRVNGGDDFIEAPLVVAADGTLSLLAKSAGLHDGFQMEHLALGVRALYLLSEDEVDARFGVTGREGATQEFLGCTDGVRGGGFIYTQTDAVSVGLVVHLDSLKEKGLAPYDLLERIIATPPAAPLLRGAKLVEYSAHLLPEAGLHMVPRLADDGLLVVGDAAGLCYTNGLIQEGMNLAMTSGLAAAEVAAEALAEGNVSAGRLLEYQRQLKRSFVLRDLRTYRRAIGFMKGDRLFTTYPRVVGQLMEDLYRSDGKPKTRIARLARRAVNGQVSLRDMATDAWRGGRGYL